MEMTQIDPEKLKQLSFSVWNFKQGEMVANMIHLGDRLGLYRSMDGAGPMTAAELADRTGLKERWLLEWLRGQAAARLVDSSDGEIFELSAEGATVLSDEASLSFAAGAFSSPMHPETLDKLAEAFKTGVGLSYEDLGPNAAHRTERMLGPWTRQALVPDLIPRLDGVKEKLSKGALVADVGCGGGIAVATMATAFPDSTFHGYDPSSHAISRCNDKVSEGGLKNLETFVAGGEDLPQEPTYDFVITFDCIHDMTHPAEVISAIRRALKPDGTWLIKDIRSSGNFQKNMKNPMLAMFYGFSVSACMSSALSKPDGAGLGTLGFPPEVAESMTRAGGFSRFTLHDIDDPSNLYYEVRP